MAPPCSTQAASARSGGTPLRHGSRASTTHTSSPRRRPRELMAHSNGKLVFPTDGIIADRFDKEAHSQVVPIDRVPPGWRMLDIGPQTVAQFKSVLSDARTIIWNGPLGVFEFPRFAEGT